MKKVAGACAVLMVLLLSQIALSTTQSGCAGCGEDRSEKGHAHKTGNYAVLPGKCPVWEIDFFPNLTVLYYCDRFMEDCNDDPEADYIIGNYNVPAICHEDCAPLTHAAASRNAEGQASIATMESGDQPPPFEGLTGPVAKDFLGHTLYGSAAKFHHVLIDPRISFIKLKNTDIYAKVLVHVVRTGKRSNSAPHHQRTIYVAYEVKREDASNAVELEATAIDPDPCHAYRATFTPTDGRLPISILVLTAK